VFYHTYPIILIVIYNLRDDFIVISLKLTGNFIGTKIIIQIFIYSLINFDCVNVFFYGGWTLGLEYNGFTQCNPIVLIFYGERRLLSLCHSCIVCRLFCLEKELRLHLKFKRCGAASVWSDHGSNAIHHVMITVDLFLSLLMSSVELVVCFFNINIVYQNNYWKCIHNTQLRPSSKITRH